MRRAWTLGLLVAMSVFLPAVRANAQTDCEALKKAFEEAKADYAQARKAWDEAWKRVAEKRDQLKKLEGLEDLEWKLEKAKAELEKWKSMNDPSQAKGSQIEVDYWTKEISSFQSKNPEAGSLENLSARIRELRAEAKVEDEALHAASEREAAAKRRYEKASLAYQACHPDEHGKVPPGTCESDRKTAEKLDVERHRLSGPGKDLDAFNRADSAYHLAHKLYCQCLWNRGVRPLPWECAYYEPKEPFNWDISVGINPKYLTEPPPPPAKSVVTPPPPPAKSVTPTPPSPVKSVTPPPPPPAKSVSPPPPPVAPPPPPKAPAPPPPSTGSVTPPPPSSTYVCGKSPCDCLKQSPPKKCTTSSCVCAKG